MKRAITAVTALGALTLGLGAPLTALDRHCPMQSSGASLCAVCDFGGASEREARVSAASCCRFEAANPAPQTPGVIPTIQMAGASHALDGAVSLADPRTAVIVSAAVRFAPTPPRSTHSPLTFRTTLRL